MADVVKAPAPWRRGKFVLFLAGVIDQGRASDWQSRVIEALEPYDITILSPRRDDWDASWDQSVDNPEFRQQVVWEQTGLAEADYRTFVWLKDSSGPITLHEEGKFGGLPGVVCCEEGYERQGNVDIDALLEGLTIVRSVDGLIEHLKGVLGARGIKKQSRLLAPKAAAVDTKCHTPGAVYHFELEGDAETDTQTVKLEVDLPATVAPLDDEAAQDLDDTAHNALEMVLAPYFTKGAKWSQLLLSKKASSNGCDWRNTATKSLRLVDLDEEFEDFNVLILQFAEDGKGEVDWEKWVPVHYMPIAKAMEDVAAWGVGGDDADERGDPHIADLMKVMEAGTKLPPALTNSAVEIIDGRHRIHAASRLGLKQIPYIKMSEVLTSLDMAKQSRLLSAKTADAAVAELPATADKSESHVAPESAKPPAKPEPPVNHHAENPAFKAWFAGSKVVDKDGNPLRCYHGTRSSEDFEEFSTSGPIHDDDGEGVSSSGSGADPTAFMGAHFAQEPKTANQFARGSGWMRSRYDGETPRPRVLPVYLSIKNPRNFGSEHNLRHFINEGKLQGYAADQVIEAAMEADGLDPMDDEHPEVMAWSERYDNDSDFRADQHRWLFEDYSPSEGEDTLLEEAASDLGFDARRRLQDTGFDGVRYKNVVEGGISWIAFDSNQIKSALGNSGNFDAGSNSITAAARVSDAQERTLARIASKRAELVAAKTSASVTAATQPVVPGGSGFQPWYNVNQEDRPDYEPVKRSITDSPGFAEWFGESKVRDGEGEPLTCFHGTSSDTKGFSKRNGGYGQVGHWFDAHPRAIEKYTQGGERSHHPNVIPVILSIKNPKVFPDLETFKDAVNGKFGPNVTARAQKMRTDLRKAGFDGVHINNATSSGVDYWCAFDQKQIKSALGNSGEFSTSDKSIMAGWKSPQEEIEEPQSEFLDDLWAQTTPKPGGKTTEVVWNDGVTIDARRGYDGRIKIETIHSAERGQGKASAAVEFLKDLAAKHDVDLVLIPVPFGEGDRLDQTQLRDWYIRHGFQKESDGYVYHAKARKTAKVAAATRDQMIAEARGHQNDNVAPGDAGWVDDPATLKWVNERAFDLHQVAGFNTNTMDWKWLVRDIWDRAKESHDNATDAKRYYDEMKQAVLDGTIDEILIVEGTDGKFHIWDGFHRVALAHLTGTATLPAWVGYRSKTTTETVNEGVAEPLEASR